jgi:hypothetical protein
VNYLFGVASSVRRRYKVLGVILALVGMAVLSFALFLSHDSPCGPAPVLPKNTNLMKSIVHRCYGTTDVLKYEDIAKPTPADNQVLVKVHAASVNRLTGIT